MKINFREKQIHVQTMTTSRTNNLCNLGMLFDPVSSSVKWGIMFLSTSEGVVERIKWIHINNVFTEGTGPEHQVWLIFYYYHHFHGHHCHHHDVYYSGLQCQGTHFQVLHPLIFSCAFTGCSFTAFMSHLPCFGTTRVQRELIGSLAGMAFTGYLGM